jgi:ABC-type spermidine/putrescine transport system permease subunit I
MIVGYLLAKSNKMAAKLFALYFSLGLGGVKLYLSLSVIKYPESIIIGIVLFLIALGIGYPLAYILYKKESKTKRVIKFIRHQKCA